MDAVDDGEALAHALDRLASHAARACDAYEVRAEVQERRTVSLDRTGLRSVVDARVRGACVRVWLDGVAGFASSHELSDGALRRAVDEASTLARRTARGRGETFPWRPGRAGRTRHVADVRGDPFGDVEPLVEVLERAYAPAGEGMDTARAGLAAERRRVLYRGSEGREADTTFALTTLLAQAVHRDGGKPGDGSAYVGGERGLADFVGEAAPEELGAEAARRAREASGARAVPAGRQRVLCDNVLTGVLAHESFGHLIEYDVVAMGWSLLQGRRGERFTDAPVSVVDAPEVPGRPRDGIRYPVDEEGVEGRPVRILDDGVLASYLHVRGSAGEEDAEAGGNGRAFSVRHPPIVRMRNIYVEPGDLTLDEALEELGDGVYLLGSKGGAPGSDGTFMFAAERGYRVENGELCEPLRRASISGHILDFLGHVEGLTRDFQVVANGFGGCGKWNQFYLPVAWGGPHLLVGEALVGGEAA